LQGDLFRLPGHPFIGIREFMKPAQSKAPPQLQWVMVVKWTSVRDHAQRIRILERGQASEIRPHPRGYTSVRDHVLEGSASEAPGRSVGGPMQEASSPAFTQICALSANDP